MVITRRSIHWLMPSSFASFDEVSKVHMASVRLRAGCLIGHADSAGWKMTVGETVDKGVALCVVGKIGVDDIERTQPRWLALLAELRSTGTGILLDYTDNHLEIASPMQAFYREALDLSDACVCSSRAMRERLGRYFDPARIHVVEDAIEVPVREMKSAMSSPVSVLWFGHASNLAYLIRSLSLFPPDRLTRLLFLTNMGGINWLRSTGFKAPGHVQMTGRVWSVPAMLEAAGSSDVCIIPSDPEDPHKCGASANRLVTALAMGLPTAASMLESYRDHRQYFVDIESEEFADMLEAPLKYGGQVRAAQAELVPGFSRDVLAARWLALFERIVPH